MTVPGTSGLSVEVATDKIGEIYQAVEANQGLLTSFGLSRGFLGVSIFNFLYGVHSGQEKYLNLARQTFDKACDMIDSDLNKSYPQDFAELGTVSQYLHEAGVLDLEPNTFLEDVDTVLLKKMRYELSQKNIGGYVNGALGYGLYFLQRSRYSRESMQPIIEELVRGILECALHSENGCYWHSWLKSQKATTYLSFPHGSAAVLLFFARIVEMDLYPASRLHQTVDDAINYIETHRVRNQHYQFIDIVEAPQKSRLALCYGDMGIGYMLLRVGSAFNCRRWFEKGLALLRACAARRRKSDTGVQDASILFGATGLALMFDRIEQITGDSLMNNTAAFWYSEILRYGHSDDGYAGFKAAYNQWHNHTNLAFSEGIIGIGCGLIKGLNPGKVNFDDLLWLL